MSIGNDASEVRRKRLLGFGFWVQGFRCFPWMAVNYFLKDGLGIAPSTLQILQNTANLPMVGKPLCGVISDAVYIRGQHRLPYIIVGGILEVLFQFKMLPLCLLLARLCPLGCEGSLMAFVMSAIALAMIVSGYLGVLLASWVGIGKDEFGGLPLGIVVQAACTLAPVFWSSWIAEPDKRAGEKED